MDTESRKVLREVTHRFPPSTFYSCSDFFRTLHKQTKNETRNYSYRQLSVDLGFSATNLVHLIVQGKRPVTERAATKIVEALDLKRDERRYFLALARLTREKSSEDISRTFREALEIRSGMITSRLEQDQFAYYSEWYHAVIREMVMLDEFQPDGRWIASVIRPAISAKQAEESLELLQKLNLIQKDPDTGRFVQTNHIISTGPEVMSLSVQKFHQESIPHGLEAMVTTPPELRHISALVLSVSASQFEKIKQEIELFQQRLLELERDRSQGNPDRVVRLNMQLFPSCLM
ncbi:TIGR02147 family protein [Oligoflexus tunisiensis]|uniref:TIGR02147 family protein n=1 Tax=Oligoflexus tunisiensis TaxID=708132 RepID=UPI00114CDEB6|nr:TIGR02147 family protein [Oligoflexus tunisiensis]